MEELAVANLLSFWRMDGDLEWTYLEPSQLQPFSSEVARFPASVATTFSKATVLTNAFAPNKPGRQHSGMEKFAGISVNHVYIGISFHLFGSKKWPGNSL